MTSYKQTELGLIPSDWEVVELGDICTLKSGQTITAKKIHDLPFGYPCYGGNGLRGYTNSYTHDGEFSLIGRQGALCGNIVYVKGKFFASEHALVVTQQDNVNAKWLSIYLEKMNLNQHSESSAQPGLSAEKLKLLNLIFPKSKPEQTAIATALSDTDALLAELEKLLAKKQAIKTATMQQLLTGKTRLPEFAHRADGTPKGSLKTEWGDIPEDWEVMELGDVGNTYAGLTGKNKDDFGIGNCFYVPFTNVMANIEVNINQLDKVNVNEKQNSVLKNDLLFNGSSETPEEICFSSLVNFDISNLYLNSFCFGFRVFNLNKIHAKYLAYWFRSNIGRKTVAFMAQGSTRYNISKSEFLKLQIIVPQKPEQTAITQILGDMDSEIKALQARIEKLREIKQGMMQNLLTGKIRLPC